MNLSDQQLGHERRIIARLSGIEGVPRLSGDYESGIDLRGAGESLANVLDGGPLKVPALLEMALHLAQTLCAVHSRGVLHQNISPEYIFVAGPPGRPMLTGFHHATTFIEEPGFTHHREIRGNLTYLAPEQTGRTGRSVDLRSDLYSLGVTLYEAATGHPPFEAKDPLQLLHDHLASVPIAPQLLRAELPEILSKIVLRLLEKEPERRYQSAEGLTHDLAQLQHALAQGATPVPYLGANDYPLQLAAPARLVGRDVEIHQLRRALEDAVHGRVRSVFVTGAAGVGKTSLINELRPLVTARRGWFVGGKFDQYRRDAPTAPAQAFRALGRLLLAEPADELSVQRENILHALGRNAGVVSNIPEFALLLGPQPEITAVDPALAEARLQAATISVLRAIVSPERPLVMVLDDLHWAGAISVRFIEAVLDAPAMPGLLLVGSYRDAEVDATHALAALLGHRRRQEHAPLKLALVNLPAEDIGKMLREMLRLAPDQAAALALAVAEHTGGNPYDTVELLNALRRDGALEPGPEGWQWNAQTLRRYVGQSGVLELLAARMARLPLTGQAILNAMACLGGQVPRRLLGVAMGLSASALEEQLAAPLEDGLLVLERGEDSSLRLRHDRVQQAVYSTLTPQQRRSLHLSLARRLAATTEFSSAAVQQYLPAVDDIDTPEERRSAASLLYQNAMRIRTEANDAVAQHLLTAALSLLSRLSQPTQDDESLRTALQINHHVVLCSLGRFEEADSLYRVIEGRGTPVEGWVEAARAQIDSLSSRSRPREAVTLGLRLLQQLGLNVPQDFEAEGFEPELERLGQWSREVEQGIDTRAYTGDARSTAMARLIDRMAYCAFFYNFRIMAWLILEGQILWTRHGPSPELAPVLAALSAVSVGLNQDYRMGYVGSRHVLGVSETRGWEPATSEARYLFSAHASHWFEPLEHGVRHAQLAREGLVRHGALHVACFACRPATTAMLDCSPTLQECVQEAESGLALALRVRHDYGIAMMLIERLLLNDLCGVVDEPQGLPDDPRAALKRQENVPSVKLSFHFCRALHAAVFGNLGDLVEHAAAAMEQVPLLAHYRAAQTRLLNTLAMVQLAGLTTGNESATLLAKVDAETEWLAERACDAPENFLHLLKWMQAERAWAVGDFLTGARAFDGALRQLETITRPWHHAMLAERCGLFYLQHGLGKCGEQFIALSVQLYQAWGAIAKVRQLEETHAFLGAARGAAPEGGVGAESGDATTAVDAIDALAILRASQALSSETSLSRLKTRVAEVMGSLTGATAVRLALWDEDLKDWLLSDEQGAEAIRIGTHDADARGSLPLSAFRYAERTREPLLVEDATVDDRFSRDPYLASLSQCSLLIVPILNQGSLRAMLLLENRLRRGAFSTGRLDAVSLIAGQLAVSLENTRLYDRLEQRVRDQTHELVAAARRSGMAQIATNVLHNVGNVLNSVNVSAHMLTSQVRQSRAARVADLADLMGANEGNLAHFFATDQRGQMLPAYLRDLARALATEREQLLRELERLGASVDHINNVVAMQQSYAGASGLLEQASISELVDDAIRIHEDSLLRGAVAVKRHYGQVEPFALDKTRVMQILVNLVKNASQAMEGVPGQRLLRVAVRQDNAFAIVEVGDNGCGIDPDNLPRLFSHGFTTKPDGHGFGLHSCAVAAMEMGGTLAAQSAGAGRGAVFTLRLPVDLSR